MRNKETHHQRYKRLGKCTRSCGRPSESGKTMCRPCLDVLKQNRKNRIAGNKCAYCGQPAYNKTICNDCSQIRERERIERKAVGLCVSIGCPNDNRPGRVTCYECADKISKKTRLLKQTVLSHYGQVCNCSCGCTTTKFEYLTIDHKNSDGAKQRKDQGTHGGQSTYRRIIKAGFPDDLQILCWNCNCAKEYYGGCQ